MFKIKNNKIKIETCSPYRGVEMNYYIEENDTVDIIICK